MNDKNSMTAKAESLSGSAKLANQWNEVDWRKAEAVVNRLQIRIAKATSKKQWNKVKRFEYLLTHSHYAKLLAVRQVSTNKGKDTAGVDGVLWQSASAKMQAVLSLTDKGYKASPLRRVYINKKKGNKKRPLSIPTMYDRAMQALYALALSPIAETTADGKSFGFRKGRSCHDACEYVFTALSRKFSPKWILEGDIKGCFDNISHDWLVENIPMDKSILKQFLKAGFVFKGNLFSTEEGTPQGGIISPILANMALDGIQQLLENHFDLNKKGQVSKFCHNLYKVNLVRYADDFIITAETPEIAQEAKEIIEVFLSKRGLELSQEKTIITNIDDGFDFLSWTFRKFKGKLIVKPAKESIQSLVSSLSNTILQRGKAWKQDVLIMKLNQQIRGWTNYHQSVCASEAFSHIDFILFELLWRWAKRRHPHKGRWWVSSKYWHRRGNRSWVFSTDEKELLRVDHIPIVRHNKVRMNANPYLDTPYFIERKFKHGMNRLSGRFKQVWWNQDGRCFHCGMPMEMSDEREIFFKVAKSLGGEDIVSNMAYVHSYCQRLFTQSRAKA